jgi:hypothetical protein
MPLSPQTLHWNGISPTSSQIIYEDCEAAVALFKETRFRKRSKHIALRWYFIAERQSAQVGDFKVVHRRPHDFNSSSSSLHPLYLHELLQRGEVMKPKVASKAIPLETPASVKQSIKTLMV